MAETQAGPEVLAVYDDGTLTAKVGHAGAVEVLLRYARPQVAAGVAVFGLGVSALPLLAHLQGASPAKQESCASEPGLLTSQELQARFGALEPAAVVTELLTDPLEVSRRASGLAAGNSALDAEVQQLQSWHAAAQAAVTRLERRSALAYLGLGSDAEADAVQKSYKQKVLTAHPDKGGSEEDFQELQAMLARIQEEETEGTGGKEQTGNLFQTLAKQAREAREARRAREEEGESEPLSREMQLRQHRLKLHDRALELWHRAAEAQQQLSASPGEKAQPQPSLALLRPFVDGFAPEVERLVHAADREAAAERLLCRFIRQGLEVLTAAALADSALTIRHVAIHFTGALLSAAQGSGPCPRLKSRCQSLLEALEQVPKNFDTFLSDWHTRLENQAASELRGCDPNRSSKKADAEGESAPAAAVAQGGHEKPPAPAKIDPFKAAVAAFASSKGAFGFEDAPKPVARTELARVEAPPTDLLVQPACRNADESLPYHQTEDWGKLRAHCVRKKLCVNFNRDNADRRCTAPAGTCNFKHACAVCGAEERGGPGAQYQHHGGWNCRGLAAWLMVHK